ncbi:solute carrier family 13 member 5-like [Centruroides sculpturatus]|uniref:solute carrier family 13 member 5-like n=1 Tax=Centruroides sculpturatus TaxID=218467 RepID=UPI000C6CE9FB|nr:solute carrier family 13 member 5-like [Centruroides sculpturatus]
MPRKVKKPKTKLRKVVRTCWPIHKIFIICFIPLILTIIIIVGNNSLESRGLYIFFVMEIFWILELLPLAVTSFFPIVLFPLLGISNSDRISRIYMSPSSVLYFVSSLFAAGIDHCNLYKRIALTVLFYMKIDISRTMLTLMTTTAVISMWISNTVTTTTIVPIVHAIIVELARAKMLCDGKKMNYAPKKKFIKKEDRKKNVDITEINGNDNKDESGIENKSEYNSEDNKIEYDDNVKESDNKAVNEDNVYFNNEEILKQGDEREEIKEIERENENVEYELSEESLFAVEIEKLDEDLQRMRKILMLSISIAAICGGTSTLIGTSTNTILVDYLKYEFPDSKEVNFLSWMCYHVPVVFLFVLLIYLYLSKYVLKYKRISKNEDIRKIIIAKYKELGPISFHEVAVLSLSVGVVISCVSKSPTFISGWQDLLNSLYSEGKRLEVNFVTPAIFFSLFLFLIPAKPKLKKSPPLLTWKKAQKHMNWDVLFIFGGSFTLAEGLKDSGVIKLLGDQLKILSNFPTDLVMIIICLLAIIFTQLITNAAVNTSFLPIIKSIAIALKVNPLYLMIPFTISCSFSFSLPMSTPSNVVVYNASGIKTIEMAKPGIIVTIICLIIELLMVISWGKFIFNYTAFPDWAVNTDYRD